MRKKVMILRFGANAPFPKEVELILELAGKAKDCANGVPFGQVGVLSLIYTEFSPAEIAKRFQETAKENNDIFPVIVTEVGSENVGLNLEGVDVSRLWVNFEQACAEFDSLNKKRVELSLDELLDLVTARGGADRLTAEEKERLVELSKAR